MSRLPRITKIATLSAVIGALAIPASSAVAGDGPVAHKSGAVVNYTSLGKIKLAKNMFINFACAVDCDVTSTTKIKGPGGHATIPPVSGSFAAGPIQVQVTISKGLVKIIKGEPGKFRIVSDINATDRTTGATDHITHSFKIKR